jgi:hypothetical protein
MPNKQVRQGESFFLPMELQPGSPFPPSISRRLYDASKVLILADPAPGITAALTQNHAVVQVTVSRTAPVAANYAVGNAAIYSNEFFDVLPLKVGIPPKRKPRKAKPPRPRSVGRRLY